MKRLIPLFIVLIVSPKSANASVSPHERDSLLHHFLNQGAWKHSIHSPEYGSCIDSALLLLPTDAYLWQQRGMPYFKEMKYEKGMSYIDSAVKYDSSMWLDYRAFLKCIFQKDYHSAILDFWLSKHIRGESYVMDHPYDFYLGLCYLQLAQFDSSKSYLQHVVTMDSIQFGETGIHFVHLFYLGVVCTELGEYQEAAFWLHRAIDQYPHFSDAEYYEALALHKLGRNAESKRLLHNAESDLEEGLTINEDNVVYERYPYQISKYTLHALESEF